MQARRRETDGGEEVRIRGDVQTSSFDSKDAKADNQTEAHRTMAHRTKAHVYFGGPGQKLSHFALANTNGSSLFLYAGQKFFRGKMG